MKKYYSFCKCNICIDAPLFFHENAEWSLFETEACQPDVGIYCKRCSKLPKPEGDYLGKNGDAHAYSNSTRVYRHVKMGTDNGAVTLFDYADPSVSETFIGEANYHIMTDSRLIWNSISMQQIMLANSTLFFHSSFIEYKGRGILFSAPCGTGKSTQAALWEKHRDAEIINGDKAGVTLHNGLFYACGIPICGTSGICKNKTLPLGAIVLLGQAKHNTVTQIVGVQALSELLKNIYLDFLVPEERIICIDLLEKLIESVPVYRLLCTPDENAVEALEKALMNGGVFDE